MLARSTADGRRVSIRRGNLGTAFHDHLTIGTRGSLRE